MNSFLSFFFSFFMFNSKFIKFFLPFSTSMTSYKKKKSVIYLLYLIVLKISVTVLAWYLVTIPFLDAHNNGYLSFYFHFAGILVAIIAIPVLFFLYAGLIRSKFMAKNRSVSVTSLLFNNWIKLLLKFIYWHFFITNFFMLLMKETNEPGLEVLEEYSFLNFFTLFAIGIIYAFTNKYFEIKIHHYFYYFFNLHLNLEEYEKRIKELSKNYSILYTTFDSHMYRSYRNLARDSRVIVLRNKYIPISFTLTYYASNFERSYEAVYQDDYVAGIRPEYNKNMRDSNIFRRTQIIQKYYPEKIKKRFKEGPIKTSIPIGKLLIAGRIISVLLIITSFAAFNNIFTVEEFLEQRNKIYSGLAVPLFILLITYSFAWFYTNIAVSVMMYFAMKNLNYTEPIIMLSLIAAFIVVNLMVLSFWKEEKIKTLLYLR